MIKKSELDKIDWSSDAGKKSVQEKYNQFVWIPCTVKEYNDANDDIIENSWQSNKQYKDNGDTDYEGTDGNGDGTDWKDNYTTDDKTVIDKVYT